jgi:hypothetical protein
MFIKFVKNYNHNSFYTIKLIIFCNYSKIFFGLDSTIVYYIWSCLVTFYILILLLGLPWNIESIFSFIISILLILTIGKIL